MFLQCMVWFSSNKNEEVMKDFASSPTAATVVVEEVSTFDWSVILRHTVPVSEVETFLAQSCADFEFRLHREGE